MNQINALLRTFVSHGLRHSEHCGSPAWQDHALLQLESGNNDVWRSVCGKLVEKYGQTSNPMLIVLVVVSCTEAPESGVDPKQL